MTLRQAQGVNVRSRLHNVLAGRGDVRREFLNLIRFLSNELRIPLVGVGTREAYLAIRSDDQLENRQDLARRSPQQNPAPHKRRQQIITIGTTARLARLHLPYYQRLTQRGPGVVRCQPVSATNSSRTWDLPARSAPRASAFFLVTALR